MKKKVRDHIDMEVVNMISENVVEAAELNATNERYYETVRQLGSCDERVVVFTVSGCPMYTVAEHLLFSLGVGPTIVALDHRVDGDVIKEVLNELADYEEKKKMAAVPAVFIGGKFLGGVEALMACHINGDLVPLLKHSGALWL